MIGTGAGVWPAGDYAVGIGQKSCGDTRGNTAAKRFPFILSKVTRQAGG